MEKKVMINIKSAHFQPSEEYFAGAAVDVFSAENISRHTDRNYALLSASGAYIRNAEVEPLRYGGEDTKENMEYFIAGKLKVMDEKYL